MTSSSAHARRCARASEGRPAPAAATRSGNPVEQFVAQSKTEDGPPIRQDVPSRSNRDHALVEQTLGSREDGLLYRS